jgi:hypothetical protein
LIAADSRYADSTVVTLTSPPTPLLDGFTSVNVIVPSAAQAYSFNYTTYMWTANDRIDILAYNCFQDATQWWRIANANPEILQWFSLTPGTIIRIPYGTNGVVV